MPDEEKKLHEPTTTTFSPTTQERKALICFLEHLKSGKKNLVKLPDGRAAEVTIEWVADIFVIT
jgi:hypothetical protein